MLVIILLLMLASTMLLAAATNSLVTGFPRYQENLILRLQSMITGFTELSARFDLAVSEFMQFDAVQLLAPGSFSISRAVSNVMTATLGFSWNFFLIIIFLMFIVAQDGAMTKRSEQGAQQKRSGTNQTFAGKHPESDSALSAYQDSYQPLYRCGRNGLDDALWSGFCAGFGILLFVLNFHPQYWQHHSQCDSDPSATCNLAWIYGRSHFRC